MQTLAPLASRYFSAASYSDSIVSLKTALPPQAVAVPRLVASFCQVPCECPFQQRKQCLSVGFRNF